MLFTPETAAGYLDNLHTRPSKKLGIPVTWTRMIVHVGDLSTLYSPQEPNIPGLTLSDTAEIGTGLFDEGDALAQTVEQITGKGFTRVDALRTARLQFGLKAHILFHEATIDGHPFYFITYLSRTPEGTENAAEAIADFKNLTWLSQQYNRLPSWARDRYDVIQPISLGYTKYQDNNYPYFTMPFVPWGELGLEAITITSSGMVTDKVPFFRYSVPYTAGMLDESETQARTALSLAHRLAEYDPENAYRDNTGTESFLKQRDDLFKAVALIHILSEGHFPTSHKINAGDFMAVIEASGLRTKLGTIRGGYQSIRDPGEFMEMMQGSVELSPHHKISIHPFRRMLLSQMFDLYQEALDLVTVPAPYRGDPRLSYQDNLK